LETSVLTGYVDTSGKDTTSTDRVITVNGCLSTCERWRQFDNQWQEYLKAEHFKPVRDTGRYLFHTSNFLTGNCKWMPDNLSRYVRSRIYYNLVGLVRKHTEYLFGYGILLDDFRRLEEDFPYVREGFFMKPGTHASKHGFYYNSRWAMENGFSPTVNYIFDQGDEFWGELSESIRQENLQGQSNVHPNIYSTVGTLTEGDKVLNSPLQAADIVAWECRKFYLKLTPEVIAGVHNPRRPSQELMRLHEEGRSKFVLYPYEALVSEIREAVEEALQKYENPGLPLGDKDPDENLDLNALAKLVLTAKQKEAESKKLELLHIWRERRKT
jgi:hypothetical protein